MIEITNTPNFAGVKITGDFYEFEQLYEMLHKIVGEDGGNPALENARYRVLGLCYDLRHANMGDRNYFFAENGFDNERMKAMGVVGSTKNLYFSFNVYYPEILFIVMALNDFISKYKDKKTIHPNWDLTITTIRNFQASVIRNVSETLTPQKTKMMLNNMNSVRNSFDNYFTQYLDQLNIRFLNWDKEKRLTNISIIAKRIAEKGAEYQKAKRQILEVADEFGVHPDEVRFNEEYPEETVW